MTDLRTAAQQALEALEAFLSDELRPHEAAKISAALRAALTQQDEPVQEPVAWNWMLDGQPYGQAYYGRPPDADIAERAATAGRTVRLLYTAPPQRKPLKEEEIDAEWRELDGEVSTMFMRVLRKFARAVERAHGIKEN